MRVATLNLSAASLARRPLAVLLIGLVAIALATAIGLGLRGTALRSTQSYRAEAFAPREKAASMVADEAAAPPTAGGAGNAARDAAAPGAFATAEASITRQLITTGQVSLAVDDVAAATKTLESVVTEAGGWIANRESSTDAEGRRSASLMIRLPSARFGAVHDGLARLGDVTQDALHTEDAGKEFVDLEARRGNLLREEVVIRELFERKGKIGDVLEVERELARVRGEIEQIEGQLRYLRNQVSYSTLAITLSPKMPALRSKVESWGLGYHAMRAARMLFAACRSVVTALLYVAIVIGPFALLVTGVALVVRRARRRLIAAP
jgi:hypothetical protein